MVQHVYSPVPFRKVSFSFGKDQVFAEVHGGAGPALLLLHGWPFHQATFRKIVPLLRQRMQCVTFDFPGAGNSLWSEDSDFSFRAMARLCRSLMRAAGFEEYHVLGHNTGGTIARLMAVTPSPVRTLILLNTEMPNHRPPYIRQFQWALRLPGGPAAMERLLKSDWFLRSPAGFGGCFEDRACIDSEFLHLFVSPLAVDRRILAGQLHRLSAIDWQLIDSLRKLHSQIDIPVSLVWGANDLTFPLSRMFEMAKQFAQRPTVSVVKGARLLVHEEQPEATAAAIFKALYV